MPHSSRRFVTLLLFAGFACGRIAAATEADVDARRAKPPVDKSRYTFFHPTPADLMRDMATDRPDKTECPFTVDAGHWQFELDGIVFSRDHDTANGADTRTTAWSVAPLNLKLGLNNWSDLQFVVEPANRTRTEDRTTTPPDRGQVTGFGDITVRYKMNFWGNDGGETAFGVMPFIKLPTSGRGLGNRAVEGGAILPFKCGLPHGWELGAQAEIDINANDARRGHHAEFISSITLGHDIVGRLAGYAELFSQHSGERGARWTGTFDLGLTFALTPRVQLDAGLNLGVSRAAPDLELFTGISTRF